MSLVSSGYSAKIVFIRLRGMSAQLSEYDAIALPAIPYCFVVFQEHPIMRGWIVLVRFWIG